MLPAEETMAFAATSTVAIHSALSRASLHLASKVSQSRAASAQTQPAATQSTSSAAIRSQIAERLAYLSQLRAGLSSANASRLGLDLTALGAAIHVGNLPSAKSAYVTFKGDLHNIPQQQLDYSASGLSQTATRADVRIALLNSITQAAQQAAIQLKQSALSDASANVGSIIDTYA